MRRVVSFSVFLMLLTVLQMGDYARSDTSHSLKEPTRDAWLTEDTPLSALVSVNLPSVPIGVALDAIAKKTGVSLHASADLQEYRVCVQTSPVPLWRLMVRIQDLFRHGNLERASCYWSRNARPGKAVEYRLLRSRVGIEDELDLLGGGKSTARRWLKQMRDYARTPPEKLRDFDTDCPYILARRATGKPLFTDSDFANDAIGSISDQQIDTLVDTGSVDLPMYSLPSGAVRDVQQSSLKIDEQNHRDGGPAPPTDLSPPSQAYLTLGGMLGSMFEGAIDVSLHFHSGYPRYITASTPLDILGTMDAVMHDAEIEQAAKREQGNEIDLIDPNEIRTGRYANVTLATALKLLASRTSMAIYAEVFPKDRHVLRVTHGKPEYLLSVICRDFRCRWNKVGGDYVVNYIAWAQARASDIPQSKLDRLAEMKQVQGRFELKDFIEMAQLSDGQIDTLAAIFGPTKNLGQTYRYHTRLLTVLTPEEMRLARSAGGVEMRRIPQSFDSDLRRVFGRSNVSYPVRVKLEKRSTIAGGEEYTITYSDVVGSAPQGYCILEGAAGKL